MKAMNEMKPISNSRNNMYKVAIILLLAYAAYSSAMKDLERLQEVAGNVQEMTSEGVGGLAKVYSATRSLAEGSQLARGPETASISEPLRIEEIAGGSVELTGLEQETVAKRSNYLAAEFSPYKKAHREASVADLGTIKFLKRETGIAGNKVACELRKREQQNLAGKEVHLNVLAQIPTRFVFARRGIQIESESDVDTASASPGRTRLRTVIRKIPARSANAQWPGVSEFKTLNEIIGFGLASAKSDETETDKSPGEISDDVSFQLLERTRRSDTDGSATHE